LLPEPSPGLLSYGLSTGTVLVTTAGAGRLVGYLLATHGDDTHLAELVVAPAYRREGRASALLSVLLARRPDGERVTLAVAADSEPARSLYREFGFERVGTSETLFDDGTALLFERSV
jgi:ribosomal-protein-alanine N-acetyltransferase